MRKFRNEAPQMRAQPQPEEEPEMGNATVTRLLALLGKQGKTEKIFEAMTKLNTEQKSDVLFTICRKISAKPEALSRTIMKMKNQQ